MKLKFQNPIFTMLPTLLLLGIGAATMNGQGLITLLPSNTVFTPGQSQDIQKIASDVHTTDYRLVQIGSLTANQVNGLLSFSIPGMETSSFSGQVELIENDNNGGTVWSGTVVGQKGSYFSFGTNAFSTTGYVKLQDKFYSFLPLGGGKNILVKHNVPSYDTEVCLNTQESPASMEVDECEIDYETCPWTIDILLLVSPEARAYLNGFDFWGLAIFSSMVNSSINQAFQNSDIPNKQVRITGVENFSLAAGYSNPVHNIATDVDNLTADPTAQTLRNQYKADIVVMLTNQGYFDGAGNQIFGRVAQIKADNAHAYAIVETPFMIAPRWSFAHEVGHLFGARHNRIANGGNDDEDVCAHARRFNDAGGVERVTILAGLGNVPNNPFSGLGRILHYSNPDIEFNGAATGTEDNDNAKAIRNTGCAIGQYRSSPFFSAALVGQGLFCKHGQTQSQTYEAVVNLPAIGNPGQPPYTYEWRWSPNPNFNPSFVIGSSQSVTISNVLACPHFYLRLKVTSSDNISVFSTKWISTAICEECTGIQHLVMNEDPTNRQFVEATALDEVQPGKTIFYGPVVAPEPNSLTSLSGINATVHPNPTSGRPTVELALQAESEVQIIITSISGSEIQNIKLGRMAEGIHSVMLDLESASPGIYFCKILAGKLPQTLKIVVTK